MKRLSLLLLFVLLFTAFLPVRAAEINISVPEPVSNFIDVFRKIDVKDSLIDDKINEVAGSTILKEKISISGISDLFNKLDEWMNYTLGINLSKLAHALAGLIVWILEAATDIFKGLVGEIG